MTPIEGSKKIKNIYNFEITKNQENLKLEIVLEFI